MEALTALSGANIACTLSGCLRRVDELWLAWCLWGSSTTSQTVSAIDPIDDAINGALSVSNVGISDTNIGCDVGLDVVEGRGGRDRTDGDDDECAQQSEELHVGNDCEKERNWIIKKGFKVLKRESDVNHWNTKEQIGRAHV